MAWNGESHRHRLARFGIKSKDISVDTTPNPNTKIVNPIDTFDPSEKLRKQYNKELRERQIEAYNKYQETGDPFDYYAANPKGFPKYAKKLAEQQVLEQIQLNKEEAELNKLTAKIMKQRDLAIRANADPDIIYHTDSPVPMTPEEYDELLEEQEKLATVEYNNPYAVLTEPEKEETKEVETAEQKVKRKQYEKYFPDYDTDDLIA